MNPATHQDNSYYARSKSRERRARQRYPFTAAAEVIEVASNTRIQARTSDVDRGGCFVDTMNSFGVGTFVMLHVTKQNRSFKTRAKVVHSENGMGMCLAFANPESSELWTLEQWLAELSGDQTPGPRAAKQDHQIVAGKPPKRDTQTALKYLVLMLIQKNVLSDAEGSALLEKVIA